MSTKLSATDLAEIGQTLALFSHVFDNRQADALGLVFTEDVAVEFQRSGRSLRGLAEVAEFQRQLPPEAADHQTVSTVVLSDPDGTVRAVSRYLAVLADGSVTNGEYRDVLVRTDGGWRIAARQIVPRYPLAAGSPDAAGPVVQQPLPEQWRASADRLPNLVP
ncbi:nuclear transport factor 2 family protein [Frankia sp. QA3]|uniref:nuclear transport factor 2 family protein n=1 Tax=Frankia sp. QA3 TaxID=710111 RepID=UPI000269C43C|nr:nuclear transport factor 2 family protein [Frankia sp. QA3]EIV94786.1 hypothetical protein FraQA3DRAFT_4568 [Frankia sp. QA3]